VVCCRNLLIYLKPQAHDRLVKRLHFALRPGGLLVLGRAERLGRQTSLFDEISKQHSIFRARPVSREQRFQVAPRIRAGRHAVEAPAASRVRPSHSRAFAADHPNRRIEQYVLRQYTTACAIIDSDHEIRHLYGPTDRYLVPPTGESRQDLLTWIRPGFYVRLHSALRQAVDGGERVDTEGHIERDGDVRRVQCTIAPVPSAVGVDGLFLVSFHEIGEVNRAKIKVTDSQEPVVRELEQELHDARRELQATIEQLEAAGEEHRASNEELLSLNEELQSSNEELEASKEELEALNEEMNTINRELEQKNTELREANADLHNLFLSTGIPTVFLNRDLKILLRCRPRDRARQGAIRRRIDRREVPPGTRDAAAGHYRSADDGRTVFHASHPAVSHGGRRPRGRLSHFRRSDRREARHTAQRSGASIQRSHHQGGAHADRGVGHRTAHPVDERRVSCPVRCWGDPDRTITVGGAGPALEHPEAG
jgi:two-component system CheB/CheR fusion protein